MISKPPPVPLKNRSPKDRGEKKTQVSDKAPRGDDTVNPDKQGQTANTKQNTKHQGYQEDR